MELPRKVYAIQHNVTKRIYIGSSKDVDNRYLSHIYQLRAGKHKIKDMQKDFDEYGENYSVFILDVINEYRDRIKEYQWMHTYNSFERGVGYNYMDKGKEMKCLRNTPPYKEGIPEILKDNQTKEQLHKLIDRLSESEVLYLHSFASKIFGNRYE